jgi:hypothetical protein
MVIGGTVPPIIPNRARFTHGRDPLTVSDIPGAAARAFATTRPDFALSTSDITGASSRVLHKKLNKVSYVCRNDDIERSIPSELQLGHNRGVVGFRRRYPRARRARVFQHRPRREPAAPRVPACVLPAST